MVSYSCRLLVLICIAWLTPPITADEHEPPGGERDSTESADVPKTPNPSPQPEVRPPGFQLDRHHDSESYDPLALKPHLYSDASDADIKAQDAAKQLRLAAKKWLTDRFTELDNNSDQVGVEALRRSILEGNCRYEGKPELGTARITMVDGDWAYSIRLNPAQFPGASKVDFMIFELNSLKPDQARVKLLLRILHRAGIMKESKVRDIVDDQQKLEEFAIEAGKQIGMEPGHVLDMLRANSAHARKWLAKKLLEGDVQVLGLKDENIAYLFFGRKPPSKLFNSRFWQIWWEKVKSPPNWGSFGIGIVCGSIQATATYFLTTASMAALAATGSVPETFVAPKWIPIVVTAWSLSYGFAIGLFNSFYRNLVYEGNTFTRILKLSSFSVLFSIVFNLIKDPYALVTAAGALHIFLNVLFNQLAKDSAFGISRLRNRLQLSKRVLRINLIPRPVRRFLKINDKVLSFQVKQADIESQISYHILWMVKMVHFVKLAASTILPVAFGVFKGLSYAYAYHLRRRLSKQPPTPENTRAIENIEKEIRDINRSLLDIPRAIIRPVVLLYRQIVKASGAFLRFRNTGKKPHLQEAIKESQNLPPGAGCESGFQGKTHFPWVG